MARVSPATHMKNLLVAGGFTYGGTGDWAVYISQQPPNTPNRSVTLYDSGGLSPNPRWRLDYPSVQVRVRGGVNDGESAWQKAREVRDRLLGKESYTAANGDRIVHVNGIGDVSAMGFDDKNRPEYVFNLQLILEPTGETGDNREAL